MEKLTRHDLFSLERYAEMRTEFRQKVMAHKQQRRLALGPNATLYFEDRVTIHYQIQEMLRIEKIFTAAGIDEELKTYNPLIPDGQNWKATFMLEYGEPAERQKQLAKLKGIEAVVWMKVGDNQAITPLADEDIERENEDKTSAVHFMRFELSAADIQALKAGAKLCAGINHAAYEHAVNPVPPEIQASLLNDLD